MNTYNELNIKIAKKIDDLSLIVSSNLLSRINEQDNKPSDIVNTVSVGWGAPKLEEVFGA